MITSENTFRWEVWDGFYGIFSRGKGGGGYGNVEMRKLTQRYGGCVRIAEVKQALVKVIREICWVHDSLFRSLLYSPVNELRVNFPYT